jgi:hypothetical protein
MNNEDYRDILRSTRQTLLERGLGAVDERIMSDIKASEGAFWDLTYYLKHLTEEVALGSDVQLANVLRRVGRNVRTESGQAIAGVRVEVSEQDRELYDIDHFDLAPNPELGQIAQELQLLIAELQEDHGKDSNRGGEG